MSGLTFLIAAILTNAISSNTDDDAIDIEMQSDMMLILSGLCDGDMHRKVNLWFHILLDDSLLVLFDLILYVPSTIFQL